jgi:hypothetical protein
MESVGEWLSAFDPLFLLLFKMSDKSVDQTLSNHSSKVGASLPPALQVCTSLHAWNAMVTDASNLRLSIDELRQTACISAIRYSDMELASTAYKDYILQTTHTSKRQDDQIL